MDLAYPKARKIDQVPPSDLSGWDVRHRNVAATVAEVGCNNKM